MASWEKTSSSQRAESRLRDASASTTARKRTWFSATPPTRFEVSDNVVCQEGLVLRQGHAGHGRGDDTADVSRLVLYHGRTRSADRSCGVDGSLATGRFAGPGPMLPGWVLPGATQESRCRRLSAP